jgi:hypothetical protein
LRLFGDDVTVGAREAALQKKSGAYTLSKGADDVIDESLEPIAIPEANIELSN